MNIAVDVFEAQGERGALRRADMTDLPVCSLVSIF